MAGAGKGKGKGKIGRARRTRSELGRGAVNVKLLLKKCAQAVVPKLSKVSFPDVM